MATVHLGADRGASPGECGGEVVLQKVSRSEVLKEGKKLWDGGNPCNGILKGCFEQFSQVFNCIFLFNFYILYHLVEEFGENFAVIVSILRFFTYKSKNMCAHHINDTSYTLQYPKNRMGTGKSFHKVLFKAELQHLLEGSFWPMLSIGEKLLRSIFDFQLRITSDGYSKGNLLRTHSNSVRLHNQPKVRTIKSILKRSQLERVKVGFTKRPRSRQ